MVKNSSSHAYIYLVFVQKGLADNVLTDGRGWGQTVEPIEELHTRNVLLSSLCVQLAPQNLGNPLGSSKKYWNYLTFFFPSTLIANIQTLQEFTIHSGSSE